MCRELEIDVLRSTGLASFEYWGAVGHYTIGSFACGLAADASLATLLSSNRPRIGFDPDAIDTGVNDINVPGFVQLADVPDKVWKKTKSAQAPYGRHGPENPNHYADIDFAPSGKKSLDALTPTAKSLDPATWRAYYKSIGWNAVSERGLLPFRVWQIYKAMVGFVAAGDVEHFVAAAGVLAHYVGDACQPLHGSYLDDGDPFRNPDGSKSTTMLPHGKGFAHGVHVAYEDDMVDANVATLIAKLKTAMPAHHGMSLVKGGQNAGFATMELMRRTRKQLVPMSIVEAYGALVLAKDTHSAPSALWKKFGAGTVKVIVDGCRTLAMLWESAWVEGKGAKIPKAALNAVSRTKLQQIYEAQDFLPSQPLGSIDQLL